MSAVLQEEADRVVMVEDGGATVTKTFRGSDPDKARQLARREFARLRRYKEALAPVEGATCPTAFELVDGETPSIRMAFAKGVPMISYLQRSRLHAQAEERLVRLLATALRRYVDTFGEPYYDFQFGNMLYDETSGVVTLLDFGIPEPWAFDQLELSPEEASLGHLIGSTIFQSARPVYALRGRQHRQAVALAAAVVRQFDVDPQRLEPAARTTYLRLTTSQVGRLRRTWYATLGSLLARRMRVGAVTFGPVTRRR